ncbi:predicted protein [Aspergillus terreus NIH2624]|uniref:ATP-grasp domain-containing protein n=1 Tax=Aspergillus terreus (strain NIH 2624 / FGSC A1156) TaxID=341663 RepID=Q0CY31_ASPTN|nr:uncharacterized protein ATEG_01403 [Aspergillus terreus NIH2624]EAU38160.1 predicted protein [Aspergillus terreus NIH2624]
MGYSESECGDLADDTTIKGISEALQTLGHHVIHVPGIKPLVNHLASGDQKDWDLMVLKHHNIPTSPFLVVPRLGEPVDYTLLEDQLPYPLFAKPVAASTSNGITASNKIQKKEKFRSVVEDLRSQFPEQDVLVETFLAGREFTVGILGTGEDARVLGVSEVTWYNPKGGCDEDGCVDFATIFSKSGGADKDMGHTHVELEGDDQMARVSQVALDAYKGLGCRDAGRVDVRFGPDGDGSNPYVIEVNPIFGLNPNHSLYTWIAKNNGLSYTDLLQNIIENALSRYDSVKAALH